MSKDRQQVALPEEFQQYIQHVIATGSWQKSQAALNTYLFPLSFINPERASGKPEMQGTSAASAVDKTHLAKKYFQNPHELPTLFFGFDIEAIVNGIVLHKLNREMTFDQRKKVKKARREAVQLFAESDSLVVDWIYSAAALSHDGEVQRVASMKITLVGETLSRKDVKRAFEDPKVLERNTRLTVIEQAKKIMGKHGSLTVQDHFQPESEKVKISQKKAEHIIVGNTMSQALLNQLARPETIVKIDGIPAEVVLLQNLSDIIHI